MFFLLSILKMESMYLFLLISDLQNAHWFQCKSSSDKMEKTKNIEFWKLIFSVKNKKTFWIHNLKWNILTLCLSKFAHLHIHVTIACFCHTSLQYLKSVVFIRTFSNWLTVFSNSCLSLDSCWHAYHVSILRKQNLKTRSIKALEFQLFLQHIMFWG